MAISSHQNHNQAEKFFRPEASRSWHLHLAPRLTLASSSSFKQSPNLHSTLNKLTDALLHRSINPSYHKNTTPKFTANTSLCPSKTSRPSVSNIPWISLQYLPTLKQSLATCKHLVGIAPPQHSETSPAIFQSLRSLSSLGYTDLTITDPFAEADEDTGETKQSQNYIHIRIQRKSHSIPCL